LKALGLGLQQPSQPHFGGRVFALMNGGSFSTTCEVLQRGVLIGEEAAGGYYGCTAGFRQELILPNSKVRLPLGMVTYYYAGANTSTPPAVCSRITRWPTLLATSWPVGTGIWKRRSLWPERNK
jgi:hypothetical protein